MTYVRKYPYPGPGARQEKIRINAERKARTQDG